MEEICSHCDAKANYSCLCTDPRTFICKQHINFHECIPGDHYLKNLAPRFKKVDPSSKKTLVEKIQAIRLEAKSQKLSITNYSLEMMRKLNSQAKSSINRLNNFIQTCEDVIKQICSIIVIPLKTTYTPLESMLLSSSSSNWISGEISGPTIFIPTPNVAISYSPSNFPSILYNYSDYTIDCSEKSLHIDYVGNTSPKTVSHNLSNACCLNVGNGKVILCAGREAYYLNIYNHSDESSITKIPPMNYARFNHTMTWIEGCPAVIGGNNGTSNITEVEILKDNKWINISPINLGKDCMTSTCSHKNAWVIGDIPDTDANIKSIEAYSDRKWKIVDFILPTLDCHVGLFCIENNLLLVCQARAYILDTKHNSVSQSKTILDKQFRNQNQNGKYHMPVDDSLPSIFGEMKTDFQYETLSLCRQFGVTSDAIYTNDFYIRTKDIRIT